MKECKYRLPCGHCDRKNELCEIVKRERGNHASCGVMVPANTPIEGNIMAATCEHEWKKDCATPFGQQQRCEKCNATRTVGYEHKDEWLKD